MNNAVIYARFSSHGQNEMSIEGQIKICTEYAEKQGLRVVKVYDGDKAKSASRETEKRKDLHKMFTDAETRVFQYIIVYDFERFARNRNESRIFKSELAKHGVRVLSATQHITDDEGGELYEMFLEWNAEKYSQRLSKVILRGIDTAVANGTFTGQRLIYGYGLVDTDRTGKKGTIKRVVVDEEQAAVIRFIFEQYAKGTPKKKIAEMLNAKGKRYNDKPFESRHFEHWLINKKYTGEFIYGGRVVNNTYPRIIDQALFDKVQARLKTKRKYKNTVKEKYRFASKIYCGHCGGLMIADGANKKNAIYRYYGCKNARKKQCSKKIESKARIEKYILDRVIDYLQDPKRVAYMAERVIAYYHFRTGENEIKSIEARIRNAEQQIEATTAAFIEAVTMRSEALKKSCQTKIDDLTILIEDLQKQQIQLQFEQGMQTTKQDIISFVHGFIRPMVEGYAERDEEKEMRFIDGLINSVYVYNEKIVVWFTLDYKKAPKIDKETTDEATKTPDLAVSSGVDACGGL